MKTAFISKISRAWLLLILLGPLNLWSQSKINILDFFYEALSKDSTEIQGGQSEFLEIALNNYDNEIVSPETIIKRHPGARKYLGEDGFMEINCEFVFLANLEDLATEDPMIIIQNIRFKNRTVLILNIYSGLDSEIFDIARLILDQVLIEKQLTIWGGNSPLVFRNSTFNTVWIGSAYNGPILRFLNNQFKVLQLEQVLVPRIEIVKNEVEVLRILELQCKTLSIRENEFYLKDPPALKSFSGPFSPTSYLQHKSFTIASEEHVINTLDVKNNRFGSAVDSTSVLFAQKSSKMELEGNTFEIPLILSSVVDAEFTLNDNPMGSISMGAAMPSTPQNQVYVDWSEIKGKMMWQSPESKTSYWGATEEELADSRSFFGLIGNHSRLLEIYKNYGNMDDANDVFLDMKALHLKRYEYLYHTEGGTTNFFRLYLNKLLSVYTRHGTDPAQAMTASLWIIIFFSVIYFFFPSDWDKASKSKLIANFQTFIQKNDDGYFRPFFLMLGGILTSFFNAVTLSVNSFVTLGFGTIPTKGLAKYICIFQGFLGWFLLSIFIVALINQILV